MSLLAYPFHFLAAIIRFVFQTLRIPLPNIPISFSSLSFSSLFSGIRAPVLDPYTEADRWVRSLEEETGASCISKASSFSTSIPQKEGVDPAGTSSSGMRSRQGPLGGLAAGRVLPDFWLGSYEDALRACQQQLRVVCAILVSAEHDDTLPFKRNTLTDPSLVDLFVKEELLLWGGDVRGRDAWSAAQKLGATTFPFVAFISLQPSMGGAAAHSSKPVMAVLSRHQGAASTSPAVLRDHITTHLLPRVKPTLQRLRAQQRERELERQLREEQDRRFEESARRDREKAEMLRVEELRREKEEKAEEDARLANERRQAAIAEAKEMWRQTSRKARVASLSKDGRIKVGLRFPDGRRVTGVFQPEDSVLSLYCLVDEHLHPISSSSFAEPVATPVLLEDLMAAHGLDADSWWGFKVFTSYPRKEIVFGTLRTIGGEGIEGSVSVELLSPTGRGVSQVGDDSDGYETEDE